MKKSSLQNNYKSIIRSGQLLMIIRELEEQGMICPTLRSCWYLLRDRGIIAETKNSYDKLVESLAKERDENRFPYGLLSDEAGTDKRGLLPTELNKIIKNLRDNNVPPELCSGILKVVMVEKRGLVDYLVTAVEKRVPVGSPEGMIRKEWAFSWIGELKDLARKMRTDRIKIIYLGDFDSYGIKIRNHANEWFPKFGVEFEAFAVSSNQLREINRIKNSHYAELHVDGYISLVKPKIFAAKLRNHLGLGK